MAGPILFVAADPRECAGLIAHWDNVRSVPLPVTWVRTGRWKDGEARGGEAIAIANGAGADRAFAAVLVAPKPSAVCNIGFCGALDESLKIGDIFVACEVRNGSRRYETLVPGVVGSGIAFGAVASIDHIAATAAEKRNLRATGASIVEMEAAGVARAAEDLDLPFYCIRAVSDLADEDFENDLNAALTAEGQFSTLRLVSGALARPGRFAELLRLKRRTDAASKKLGDFLADCTF